MSVRLQLLGVESPEFTDLDPGDVLNVKVLAKRS
jgi:hypothetical protein